MVYVELEVMVRKCWAEVMGTTLEDMVGGVQRCFWGCGCCRRRETGCNLESRYCAVVKRLYLTHRHVIVPHMWWSVRHWTNNTTNFNP